MVGKPDVIGTTPNDIGRIPSEFGGLPMLVGKLSMSLGILPMTLGGLPMTLGTRNDIGRAPNFIGSIANNSRHPCEGGVAQHKYRFQLALDGGSWQSQAED
jgi:hypothetical protein